MFYAKNQYGEIQSVYQFTLEELKMLKKEPYFCPNCHERLQIRSGRRVTPHFAHFPTSNCDMKHSGESPYHEAGKWALYQWLAQQNYQVEMEYYLPELKQRPDILLINNGRKIAIEFQCATIPVKDVEKRTSQYLENGIFPLWVLGKNQFRPLNRHQLSFTNFHQTFLYHFHQNYQLFFYDPMTDEITIASSVQGISGYKVFARIKSFSLNHTTFPQLFTSSFFSLYPLWESWERLLYNHRTKYRNNVSSKEWNFRQYLYLKGYHFSLIPTACFLPLNSQVTVGSQPYIWQARLILEHFVDLPVGNLISFPDIKGRQTINGHQPNLSVEYMNMLASLGILKRGKANRWIKGKDVVFHKHMKAALRDDQETIKIIKSSL